MTFQGIASAASALFARGDGPLRWGAVERAVQDVYVDALIDLADDARAAAGVRALTEHHLHQLAALTDNLDFADAAIEQRAHATALARRIRAFLGSRDRGLRRSPAYETPPGSPIGGRD